MTKERYFRNLQPYEFEWRVPKDGYEWIEGQDVNQKKGIFLIERLTSGVGFRRRYKPIEDETGLFRHFAQVNPTRDGILQFSNQHGSLGAGATELVDVPLATARRAVPRLPPAAKDMDESKPTGLTTAGENLLTWRKAVIDMRRAVEMFDAIKENDTRYMAQFIRWHGPDNVVYEGRIGDRKLISVIDGPYSVQGSKFQYRDVRLPAIHFLQQFVNGQLEANPSIVRLLWDQLDRPSVFVCPIGLLGAMWLQLSLAIDGDRNYRQCRSCSKWFEIGVTRRADSTTCSDACRKRLSRAAKAAIVRRHAK